MFVVEVNESNIAEAGYIHSESWKASHRDFCSDKFVEKHTAAAQVDYLRSEIKIGKQMFMLIDKKPVGIISIGKNIIENLYVLPCEQNQGYGTKLLKFAIECCNGTPKLWILNINDGARRLYSRNGFKETGNRKQLNNELYEIEISL